MGKKKQKKAVRTLRISSVPIPNVLGKWSGRNAEETAGPDAVEAETGDERPAVAADEKATATPPTPEVKTYGTARPTVTPNGQPTTLVVGERRERVTPAPKKDFKNPIPHRAKTIERSIDGAHRIRTAPLILLTLTAHRKSCAFIRLVPSGEIGWLGTVKELDDNRYLVTDCFLFEQEVQMFECDINGRKVADMAVDLIKKGRADLAGSIKFWAHLHPHGSTSPSGQDERMSREWGAGNEENVRFMIRAIYTCDGRAEFTFFDYVRGIQWKDCQWATYSEPSKKFDEEIQKEIDEKLKRPAPTYTPTTEFGQGGGGYHGYQGQSQWGQGRGQRYDPVAKRWIMPGEGYVTRPTGSPAAPVSPATTGVLVRGDEPVTKRERTGNGPIQVPIHGPDDEDKPDQPTKPRIRLTAALGQPKKEPDGLAAASGEPQDDETAEEPKTLTASIGERMKASPKAVPEKTATEAETEANAEDEATETKEAGGDS